MSKRRASQHAGRGQKIVATVLLVCMIVSGLAFYAAAATTGQPSSPPTQQSR